MDYQIELNKNNHLKSIEPCTRQSFCFRTLLTKLLFETRLITFLLGTESVCGKKFWNYDLGKSECFKFYVHNEPCCIKGYESFFYVHKYLLNLFDHWDFILVLKHQVTFTKHMWRQAALKIIFLKEIFHAFLQMEQSVRKKSILSLYLYYLYPRHLKISRDKLPAIERGRQIWSSYCKITTA